MGFRVEGFRAVGFRVWGLGLEGFGVWSVVFGRLLSSLADC